ncbi:acyl-CoA thioesterase [Bacteroidota bacterium]
MIAGETQIRVRYGETDSMGYVYYGNFALYYEIGRTDLLRQYGLTYKDLEEQGILMPVVSMTSHFKRPAFYDDFITIRTTVKKLPGIKIHFFYELFSNNQLINTGDTVLTFFNREQNKPVKCPEAILNRIRNHFEK